MFYGVAATPKVVGIRVLKAENLKIASKADGKTKKPPQKWKVTVIGAKKKMSTETVVAPLGNPIWDCELIVKVPRRAEPLCLLVTDSDDHHVGQVIIPVIKIPPRPANPQERPTDPSRMQISDLEPTKKATVPVGTLFFWIWVNEYRSQETDKKSSRGASSLLNVSTIKSKNRSPVADSLTYSGSVLSVSSTPLDPKDGRKRGNLMKRSSSKDILKTVADISQQPKLGVRTSQRKQLIPPSNAITDPTNRFMTNATGDRESSILASTERTGSDANLRASSLSAATSVGAGSPLVSHDIPGSQTGLSSTSGTDLKPALIRLEPNSCSTAGKDTDNNEALNRSSFVRAGSTRNSSLLIRDRRSSRRARQQNTENLYPTTVTPSGSQAEISPISKRDNEVFDIENPHMGSMPNTNNHAPVDENRPNEYRGAGFTSSSLLSDQRSMCSDEVLGLNRKRSLSPSVQGDPDTFSFSHPVDARADDNSPLTRNGSKRSSLLVRDRRSIRRENKHFTEKANADNATTLLAAEMETESLRPLDSTGTEKLSDQPSKTVKTVENNKIESLNVSKYVDQQSNLMKPVESEKTVEPTVGAPPVRKRPVNLIYKTSEKNTLNPVPSDSPESVRPPSIRKVDADLFSPSDDEQLNNPLTLYSNPRPSNFEEQEERRLIEELDVEDEDVDINDWSSSAEEDFWGTEFTKPSKKPDLPKSPYNPIDEDDSVKLGLVVPPTRNEIGKATTVDKSSIRETYDEPMNAERLSYAMADSSEESEGEMEESVITEDFPIHELASHRSAASGRSKSSFNEFSPMGNLSGQPAQPFADSRQPLNDSGISSMSIAPTEKTQPQSNWNVSRMGSSAKAEFEPSAVHSKSTKPAASVQQQSKPARSPSQLSEIVNEKTSLENESLRSMLNEANKFIETMKLRTLNLEKELSERTADVDRLSCELCCLHNRLLEDGMTKYLEKAVPKRRY